MKKLLTLLLILVSVSLFGQYKIRINYEAKIAVTIEPLADVARIIGGNTVEVITVLPEGSNPENFTPSPKMLNELRRMEILVLAGAPYEKQLVEKIERINTKIRFIDATVGLEKREISAGAPDPHSWFSCRNMIKIAEHIKTALFQASPGQAMVIEKRCKMFQDKMRELDKNNQKLLAPYKGKEIFVQHPAYGYFLADYGLKQVAIEKEGKAPNSADLNELLKQATEAKAQCIICSPLTNDRHAETLAEKLKIKTVKVNPVPSDVAKEFTQFTEILENDLKNRK